MDLKQFTFEQLVERLGKRSPKELRKLALGYNIELPAGVDDKDLILRAMHESLTASGQPTSAVDPGASSSPAPADVGPRITVLSNTGRPYWRCGFRFMTTWSSVPTSRFTISELEMLRADKNVRIRDLPAE